jgi:hypothetical protein
MLWHSQTGSPNIFLLILDACTAEWQCAKNFIARNEACGSFLCSSGLVPVASGVSLAHNNKKDN